MEDCALKNAKKERERKKLLNYECFHDFFNIFVCIYTWKNPHYWILKSNKSTFLF